MNLKLIMKVMKQVKLDKVKKILSLIFLILWCLLIFYFSNQPGSVSSHSSGLIVKMVRIIIPTGNIELLTFIIRKLAHMFLYFMLTILTYNCFKQFNFKKKYLIILFCFLYAISDEIHQLFIVNRSCELRDVLIDMIGVLIGYFLIKIKESKTIFKRCKKVTRI